MVRFFQKVVAGRKKLNIEMLEYCNNSKMRNLPPTIIAILHILLNIALQGNVIGLMGWCNDGIMCSGVIVSG